MTAAARIGVITPSSNTVVEPVTSAIAAQVPGASAHFARFTVKRIGLSDALLAQFDMAPMLEAAALLADAKTHVIAWSGTAASWMGFARDEALCAAIAEQTGAKACSAVLALNELIATTPGRRFALVTPYTPDVQDRIVANYAAMGWQVVAEAHFGIADNYAFAGIAEADVMDACRRVAASGPEAIVVMCTNMRGATLAEAVERELGVPLFDSTSATAWKALRLAGADLSAVTGWGRWLREQTGGTPA